MTVMGPDSEPTTRTSLRFTLAVSIDVLNWIESKPLVLASGALRAGMVAVTAGRGNGVPMRAFEARPSNSEMSTAAIR